MSTNDNTQQTISSLVAWLEDDAIDQLLDALRSRDGDAITEILRQNRVNLAEVPDLLSEHWRESLIRGLESRQEEDEEDANTVHMPDYTRFAADLRGDD